MSEVKIEIEGEEEASPVIDEEEAATDNDVAIAAIEADKEVAIAAIRADAEIQASENYAQAAQESVNKEDKEWYTSRLLAERLDSLENKLDSLVTVEILETRLASLQEQAPPLVEIETAEETSSIQTSMSDETSLTPMEVIDGNAGDELAVEIPGVRVDAKPVRVPIIKLV